MQLKQSIKQAVGSVNLGLLGLIVFAAVSTEAVQAQSITPAEDGTNTVVTPDGDRFDISGGQRSADGANLFHSFERFGLDANQIANFLSDAATQNILARVVGGEASVIQGQIQVSGSSANLFLMNPAGMMFSASASLNVPASFTATTANGIGFGETWFSASGTNDYASLSGTPHQYAFTVDQPGAIINEGNLAVGIGQSLTLLGGTVISTGQLSAPGGAITVAAVPGQNWVRLSQAGSLLSLDIQPIEISSTQPNPWNLAIASLPELLTGGNEGSATNIMINREGQVVLIGSGLTVNSGDVAVENASAQTLTLAGTQNIILGNLPLRGETAPETADESYPTLQADPLSPPETFEIRDSSGNVFTAQVNGSNYVLSAPLGFNLQVLGSIEILLLPPGGENVPPMPAPTPAPAPAPAPTPGAETPSGGTSPIVIDVTPRDSDSATSYTYTDGQSSAGTVQIIVVDNVPLPPQPEVLPDSGSQVPTAPQGQQSRQTGAPAQPNAQMQSVPETDSTGGATSAAAESTHLPHLRTEDRIATRPGVNAANSRPSQLSTAIAPDCWATGQVVEKLGATYRVFTDSDRVIECYQKELAIAQQQNNLSRQGQMLYGLGAIYFVLGNYAQSTQYYEQSLAIFRQSQNRSAEAQTLGALGATYSALGNYPKAIEYYEQSLAITETTSAPQVQAVTLRNLGIAYLAQGNLAKAIAYPQQSLALAQATQDRRSIGQALGNIGLAYLTQGDYKQAIDYLEQHLAIAQELQDRSGEKRALGNLGLVHYGLKQYGKAADYQRQALAIAQELQDYPAQGQALNNLGNALLEMQQFAEAEQALRASVEVWETLRAKLGSNDTDKISLFETQSVTYSTLQEALIAQNKTTEALEIAERGRARAFVELLAKQIPQGQSQRLSENLTIEPPSFSQIQKIAREQNATLVEYSVIRQVVQVGGTRQIKDAKLYIWVIQPTGELGFETVDLTPLWQQQTSLEELVVSTRASIGVEGRGLVFNQQADVIAQAIARIGQRTQNPQLRQLHQLLIEPIADLLPADPNAKVVFIPQGPLFLTPFPALQDKNGNYLVEKHTPLTAPAIQVLALTRQQRQRIQKTGWQNAVVLGNPTMPSLPGVAGARSQPLLSLPGAEQEATRIASLLKTQAITGSQATKAAIIPKMPQARVIHLATHGLLEDFSGLGIPGAIALAPSAVDNGLLTASDILQLRLSAELVVLSACDTGQGRITGDGVIGLSRSFISAGVPSVVVSLWQVPDGPTAFLMTEFYQNLQQTPDKAQALRQAMLTTLGQHPDPRDWAAFTLIGEAE